MSMKVLRDEVARFLGDDTPGVICIVGAWGVGKTHLWNDAVQAEANSGRRKDQNYSYVSAFGAESIDSIKNMLLSRTVKLFDSQPSDRTGVAGHIDRIKKIQKKITWGSAFGLVRNLKWIENNLTKDIMSHIMYMSMQNQIVCIDDIERKSSKIDISDLLGMVSRLRVEQKCRVCIIFNQEELSDCDKEAFRRNLDKVVDKYFEFKPDSAYSANIAISGSGECAGYVRDRAVKLNITNIRVIRRCYDFARRLEEIIHDVDRAVWESCISSVVLSVWCHDQPSLAPTYDFLRRFKWGILQNDAEKTLSSEELAWSDLLDRYRHAWESDLDEAILSGIRSGYFGIDLIRPIVLDYQERDRRIRTGSALGEEWDLFHDSFQGNAEDIVRRMTILAQENIAYLDLSKINSIVRLFRDIGNEQEADHVTAMFVDAHWNGGWASQLRDLQGFGDYIDPTLVDDLQRRAKVEAVEIDARQLMIDLVQNDTDDTIDTLSRLRVENFVAAFKAEQGATMRQMIYATLKAGRFQGASAERQRVSDLATSAVRQIGAESKINSIRIKKFGKLQN
ncbi:hypothetical protein STAQ_32260 [Allostella sp. ATCC 35155]|nr:hypothetical protein STAQ_32260 [Stella sp. ATCC 35155]